MDEDDLITVADAARLKKVTRNAIKQAIARGIIVGKKIGTSWFTYRSGLEAYIPLGPGRKRGGISLGPHIPAEGVEALLAHSRECDGCLRREYCTTGKQIIADTITNFGSGSPYLRRKLKAFLAEPVVS